jgi:hypothetical protein
MEHDINTTPEPAGKSANTATTQQPGTCTQRVPEVLRSCDATTTKFRQRKDRLRSKAKRARPHILVILACLAWLITAFTVLSTGLIGAMRGLDCELEGATLELKAQRNLEYQEDMLYAQLDEFLPTQLGKDYMETYDDCLARALQQADGHLFGLGFQYPDIRNQTIGWATDNCGRLHYAPQVSQPTIKQNVLNRWAQTRYQGRRFAGQLLQTTTHHVTLVRFWLAKHMDFQFLKIPKQSHTHEPPFVSMETPEGPVMPSGFVLDCEKSPCRPVYVPTTHTPTDKARVCDEAIAKSQANIQKLCDLWIGARGLRTTILFVVVLFKALELFSILLYFAIVFLTTGETPSSASHVKDHVSTYHKFMVQLTKEDRNLAFGIVGHYVAQYALLLLQKVLLRAGCRYANLPYNGAIFDMSVLIAFCVPGVGFKALWKMYSAIKELYLNATSLDDLNNAYTITGGHITEKLTIDKPASRDSTSSEAKTHAPTSMVRELDPPTPRSLESLSNESSSEHQYYIGKSNSEAESWPDIDLENGSEVEPETESDMDGEEQSESDGETGSDWSVIEA